LSTILSFNFVRRLLIVLLILCSSAALVPVQIQEKKLLDRLLKPDMALQNRMQGKQFVPSGKTITKQAPTKTFHVTEKKLVKAFWNTREAPQREFQTSSSQDGGRQANVATRGGTARLDVPYATPAYDGVRFSSDAEKPAPVFAFAGERTFEARGKSQRFLSAQDRPLTIDQVRELLNKNK